MEKLKLFFPLFVSLINKNSPHRQQKRISESLSYFKNSDKKFSNNFLYRELELVTFARITNINIKNNYEMNLWQNLKKKENLSWKEINIARSYSVLFVNETKQIGFSWKKYNGLFSVILSIFCLVIYIPFISYFDIKFFVNLIIDKKPLKAEDLKIVLLNIFCIIFILFSIIQLAKYFVARKVYKQVTKKI
jgi:post-segregation antitoxin (ccd killing protein)